MAPSRALLALLACAATLALPGRARGDEPILVASASRPEHIDPCPNGTEIRDEAGHCVLGQYARRMQVDFAQGDALRGSRAAPAISFIQGSPSGHSRFRCNMRALGASPGVLELCLRLALTRNHAGLSSRLADRFMETGQCPRGDEDVAELEQVIQEYEANPFPIDYSEITVAPINPHAEQLEGHLPVACGYNPGLDKTYDQMSLYFSSPTEFYGQAPAKGGHEFQGTLIPGETNLFRVRGYRSNTYFGDSRFIPLDQGLYLQTYEVRDPSSGQRRRVFYGLVFAPTQRQFVAKACREYRALTHALESLGGDLDGSFAKNKRILIAQLMQRGEDVERLKKMAAELRDLSFTEEEREAELALANELLAELDPAQGFQPDRLARWFEDRDLDKDLDPNPCTLLRASKEPL